MTTVYFNNEGGTNGSGIGVGDTGSGTPFDAQSITSGSTKTYDNTHVAHGSLASRWGIGTTAGRTLMQWNTSLIPSSTQGTWYFRANVYLTSYASANLVIGALFSATTIRAGVGISSTGKLTLVGSTFSLLATGTSTIPLNQWVRIEAKLETVASPSLTARYYSSVDGTSITDTITASGDNTGTVGNIGVGICSTNLSSYNALWMDDIAASDTGYVGPAVQAVTPTGISTAQAFGTPKITSVVKPSGIGTAEAFGTPKAKVILRATGIPSAEAFGNPTVFGLSGPQMGRQVTGIPSAEAFGLPVIFHISPPPKWTFTPPTIELSPPDPRGERLWLYYRITLGVSVLKYGSTYKAVQYPSQDDIAAADFCYLGGHVYDITADEALLLAAAGFNDGLDDGLGDAYGIGPYGSGRYGQ